MLLVALGGCSLTFDDAAPSWPTVGAPVDLATLQHLRVPDPPLVSQANVYVQAVYAPIPAATP